MKQLLREFFHAPFLVASASYAVTGRWVVAWYLLALAVFVKWDLM